MFHYCLQTFFYLQLLNPETGECNSRIITLPANINSHLGLIPVGIPSTDDEPEIF